MHEKMYETGHDRGEVQRGADHSFEPTALESLHARRVVWGLEC